MKKIYFIAFGILLFAGLVSAQNDTIYLMKSGAVVMKHSIKEADIDSIIFYAPVSIGENATDIDGNVYKTVKIGNQIWMAENLRVTHFNDGAIIPLVTENTVWKNLRTPGYCWYFNNETSYKNTYGAMYNWYSVNTGKLAPDGWHVASDADWITLTNYLGDVSVAGGMLKETGTSHWWSPNTGATNITGFTALPGGHRGTGNYMDLGGVGVWWTTTEISSDTALAYVMAYNADSIYRQDFHLKLVGFSVRCVKNTISCPVLTTNDVTNIGQLTATSGGTITSDGGAAVTARGVCWSTNQNPTIADSKTTDGTGTGEFTSSITGLTANTTYYIRAYATNSVGTCYGEELSFKTKDYVVENCGTVTDIDGNVYQTVKIGNQCWMAENLRTTKYRNGDAIPNVTASSEWVALTTGAWCVYNNNASYASTYGLLYNWYAVGDTRGLAPEGWHVASTEEWQTMANYLIANGYNYDGSTSGNKIGKAVGTTENWISSSYPGGVGNNQSSNNKSGFSIPPGGGRQHATGDYFVMNYHSNLYTSTEVNATHARMIGLYFDADYLMLGLEGDGAPKYLGASVRCVKD